MSCCTFLAYNNNVRGHRGTEIGPVRICIATMEELEEGDPIRDVMLAFVAAEEM